MSGGSKTAVYAAIGANSLVTVAKTIGFFLTGSGAMMSEAIHSAADVGNQVLLAVGMTKAQKPADDEHPYGYGQEAFVWALISAVGMFFLGCGVSIAHAVQALSGESHHVEITPLAIGILVFALVIEGASAGVAVMSLRGDAKAEGQGFMQYIRETDDPFGVAVLLEDGAAVFGVLLALSAVLLTKYTGNPRWDAYGTLAIGVLLGLVAVYLIVKNRAYLVGKAISKHDQALLAQVLRDDPAVEAVGVQRTLLHGADDYKVSAEIDLDGAYLTQKYLEGRDIGALHAGIHTPQDLQALLDEVGEGVINQAALEIDRLEARIRDVIPEARDIALEPD